MMAETAVCESCGVDVRGESSFCYNCGKPVTSKRDDPAVALKERDVEGEVAIAAPEEVASPPDKSPLHSAASLRKQRRAVNRQPVEVRWEKPTGLGIGFILTAIFLTVAALALMVLALYLR
jgi:hypothetical protein